MNIPGRTRTRRKSRAQGCRPQDRSQRSLKREQRYRHSSAAGCTRRHPSPCRNRRHCPYRFRGRCNRNPRCMRRRIGHQNVHTQLCGRWGRRMPRHCPIAVSSRCRSCRRSRQRTQTIPRHSPRPQRTPAKMSACPSCRMVGLQPACIQTRRIERTTRREQGYHRSRNCLCCRLPELSHPRRSWVRKLCPSQPLRQCKAAVARLSMCSLRRTRDYMSGREPATHRRRNCHVHRAREQKSQCNHPVKHSTPRCTHCRIDKSGSCMCRDCICCL